MSQPLKTLARQLVERLDEEIRRQPRGTIRHIERALGHANGWWQWRVKAGDLTFRQGLAVLDVLGLDLFEFLRRSLNREESLDLDRPRGEAPNFVTRARERASLCAQPSALDGSFLDRLETEHTPPQDMLKLADWVVDHVRPDLLPRLLGMVGSAYGLQFRLDEAEQCIYAGIELARQQGDRSALLGRLMTRLSYVYSNRGDRRRALRMTERAAALLMDHGDDDGLSRALVAKSIWLYYLDRVSETVHVAEHALKHLAEGSNGSRFAALQVSGLAHLALGNLEKAHQFAVMAETALPANDPVNRGKLLWLRARISAKHGELEESAVLLQNAVTIFREAHLGETALAICELARIRLAQKDYKQAFESASSMAFVLKPLERNPIVATALRDLVQSGCRGLTLSLLDALEAALKKERQNSDVWHSLIVRPVRP